MELNLVLQDPRLGTDLSQLGSSSGLYLNHKEGEGWSLVSLNCIERFFRWLGFYASTHLDSIINKLSAEPNVSQELRNKIVGCWNTAHPNPTITCPLRSFEPARVDLEQQQSPRHDPLPPLPRQSSAPAHTGSPEGRAQSKGPEATAQSKATLTPTNPNASPLVDPNARPPLAELDFAHTYDRPMGQIDFKIPEHEMYLRGNIATDKLRVGGAVISIGGGDLLDAGVPCIVNAANEQCLGGGGIDGAIHAAAGTGLRQLCLELQPKAGTSVRCATGEAVITGSANLAAKGIHSIIHAVGPDYRVNKSEDLLERVYWNIMDLAEKNGRSRLAIPSISTGIFAFPFKRATEIAIRTIERYLNEHPGKFEEVKLIFLDDHPNPHFRNAEEDSLAYVEGTKQALNCAWAVHIARKMEHQPGVVLEKAANPPVVGF